MEGSDKVRMLQIMYAGVLADSVLRLGNEGVLEKVTQQKRTEQLTGGKARAMQMGMSNPEDVFTKLSELMGCANWTVSVNEESKSFTATASHCMLCALAKKAGADSPCRIYCLDPMEGMVKGIEANAVFEVERTLFEAGECRVLVTRVD